MVQVAQMLIWSRHKWIGQFHNVQLKKVNVVTLLEELIFKIRKKNQSGPILTIQKQ